MYWILRVLKNYAEFNGRARLKEFWYFFLFVSILNILLFVLSITSHFIDYYIYIFMITILFNALLIIPSIAVSIRRLHDINKSGYWYLISLLSLIGSVILLLFFMTRKGTQGANMFGQDPLDIENKINENTICHKERSYKSFVLITILCALLTLCFFVGADFFRHQYKFANMSTTLDGNFEYIEPLQPIYINISYALIGIGFTFLAFSIFYLFHTLYRTPAIIKEHLTTQVRRVGFIICCIAFALLIVGVTLCFNDNHYSYSIYPKRYLRNPHFSEFLDTDNFYGNLNIFSIVLLIPGIVIFSGLAERLCAWIKYGK